MGKPGKTAVPFTQKHFGTKGMSTDDSHVFTKSGANAMKSAALYAYGKSDKVLMQNQGLADSKPEKPKKAQQKETDAQRRERLSIGERATGIGGDHGQRKLSKNVSARVGKEYGATDLAVEIPRLYNKAKSKIKSIFNFD